MNNVINWFEIAVTDMDRAIAFYEPVMQVALKREAMECAELAVFPHEDPATGGALAKFDGITPSPQGHSIEFRLVPDASCYSWQDAPTPSIWAMVCASWVEAKSYSSPWE
jgi:predicted enzyme related to lactoylglutathione lyase